MQTYTRLDSRSSDFELGFRALLAAKREVSQDVDDAAAAIIADVRARGDVALFDLTHRFDRVDLRVPGLRVTAAEIAAARAAVPDRTFDALKLARDRILAFHERQKPEDQFWTDALGVELGWRWTAIRAVGLYVPGGTAAYPSSVLMNAIPAKVAGCERVVIVVPTPDGVLNPLVLVAAELAGVDEIYRVGGAQAVAALAYGTESIAPVFKIVGPGNAYVAAAKRRVFGHRRHRHDRRAVRGADPVRFGPADPEHGSRRTSWRRPSTTASAQVHPRSPTMRGLGRRGRGGGGAPIGGTCPAAAIAARQSWRPFTARSCWCPTSTPRQSIWWTGSRPSISRSWRPDADALARPDQ